MRIVASILSLICLLTMVNCEITVDPPEPEFFISGSWRMSRAQKGQIETYTQGFEDYRLILNDSTGAYFENRNGLEQLNEGRPLKCPEVNGTWELNSTATELILTPEDCTDPDSVERWTIIAVELRRLRLERKLSEDKRGTFPVTYFLEAVPQ